MKRCVSLGISNGGLCLALDRDLVPKGARPLDRKEARLWIRGLSGASHGPFVWHALGEIAEALGYRAPFGAHVPIIGPVVQTATGTDGILATLESAVADGRLHLFRSASTEGGGKGKTPDKPDPKPDIKTSWIKFKLADDLALQPVPGVTISVTVTDGQKRDCTTRADGMIEINGIPPGTCDTTASLKGAKLASTLTFMGAGESAGGQKSPDDEPIPAGSFIVATVEQYKVKKGDTLDSIAGQNGLSGQDLAIFNFGSSDPDFVNNCIRARVGSKTLGPDNKTFVLDDTDKPGLLYIPKEWKQDGLATEKTHTLRLRTVVARWLAIVKVDDHFAPSKENLDIKYSIGGLAKKKVMLEIKSDHYKDGPIFEHELTDEEKKDGEHTFEWDGKTTCKAGDLKDHYLNPLFAPYKVHIYVDATYTDEAEFKVLYHSIEIRKGPWTPDEVEPPEANEKEWVRYKLNELGYWGGPVDQDYTTPGDTNSYLKKAIIRYKANHKALHQLKYSKYNDKIDDVLKAALKAGDNERTDFLDEAAFTDTTAESKIRIEAITYEDGEFGNHKSPYEKARMNRPLIPVEVDIYVKNKADGAEDAPEAVGACRINWKHVDEDEDLSPQFAKTATEPSHSNEYIEKVLKLKGGRSGKGDNAHKSFGGIRDDKNDWETAWAIGKQYTPYESKKDKGNKAVYSKACTDGAKYPKRVGKAGIFFQPSHISGDDYKLTAEIDFTDLPNKADLEKLHGVTDVASRIHVDTGKFRIWRFNKVAMVVNWPARTNSEDWGLIHTEFEKAWLDVDVGSITYKKITDVLAEDEYRKIVAKKTGHKHNPPKKTVELNENWLVGMKPPQQKKRTAKQYRDALKAYADSNFWDKIYDPLREQLSKNIRKDFPTGFIIVNFLAHEAVDVLKAPGKKPPNNTIVDAGYVTWTFSIGLPDSVVFADQKDPDKVYYVVAHEMGHNFYLQHWENAGEVWEDHDHRDHNCVMAYSGESKLHPHQKPGVYTPHFCGKCNINLRGWNVIAKGIPSKH